MCVVVIAGGPNKKLSSIRSELEKAESVICADSGADSLMELRILPDEVWGDMDSISPQTLDWISQNHIKTSLFPVEKDMTDAELCLTSIPKEKEILFVTSLVGRPDHVMANLLLVKRLTDEGYKIIVTDGETWVWPLSGECSWRVPEKLSDDAHVCSLIPLGKGALGVTTFGMKYSLKDKDIFPGSSLTVSNRFDMTKKEHGFDLLAGNMLVIVTPET